MAAESERNESAPGVLYYDPNPTSAKLASATLRLAGYAVFYAASPAQAVDLCRVHGPGGDRSIHALLVDASYEPRESAALLASILQIPGTGELPGILIVGSRNIAPFRGAENLPQVVRPFTSPALVRVVHEAMAKAPSSESDELGGVQVRSPEERLRDILASHLPANLIGEDLIRKIYRALDEDRDLPDLKGDIHLYSSLRTAPLEAVLEMLGNQGVRGIVTVTTADDREGRLHIDRGYILLAEYFGDDEDLKIGRFIRDEGALDDDELERVARATETDPLPLGKRLLRANKISEHQLKSALLSQAREVTCHLLACHDGLVSFRPTTRLHALALSAAEEGGAAILLSEVLLEGLRRLEQVSAMGPDMPGVEDVYLRNDDQLARIGKEALDQAEIQVLEQVNGRASLKEIARKNRMGTFAVSRVLYRMAKAQFVRKRLPPVINSSV